MDVQTQTDTYLPFISIESVEFNTSHLLDGYKDQILEVSIKFSIPSLGATEVISVGTLQESL